MKDRLLIVVIAALALIVSAMGVLYYYSVKYDEPILPSFTEVFDDFSEAVVGEPASGIDTFDSEEEFKTYLFEGDSQAAGYYGGFGFDSGVRSLAAVEPEVAFDEVMMFEGEEAFGLGGAMDVERVSETNVQVTGIDEPDIVKTNGEEIFYSLQDLYYYYWREPVFFEEEIAPYYPEDNSATKLVSALPPEEIGLDSEIDLTGDLLLVDDTLIVIDYYEARAYDVSDVTDPQEVWNVDFVEGGYETARLYDGKVYLVTSTWIDHYSPCPIEPIWLNDAAVTVECGDIYHPVDPIAVDSTYDVFVIDPFTGTIDDQLSFVGSYGQSVVYMSTSHLYITYVDSPSMVDLMIEFYDQDAFDLVSGEVLQKIRALAGYEISEQAKLTELQVLLSEYYVSLDDDESLRITNEVENRMQDFLEERKRSLMSTGIVKIDNKTLSVKATGKVPGTLLNQFSMDEYDGYLRLTTTIGSSWFWMFGSGPEEVNDLYVLDKNLSEVGSVLDLGEGERIYSTRFVGDKGYLVTFKQIDPFFVFDLSNPRDPQKTGELKIPGYSSYLHPLTDDLILGIGEEDWNVKLSLFDVSDPSDPQEVSKYLLDEYWSEVLETHHAFLYDEKHGVFFMPGYQGGYIFGFDGSELELIKAVANVSAERALFINDYLYIIGTEGIVVLDETDWSRVGELDF